MLSNKFFVLSLLLAACCSLAAAAPVQRPVILIPGFMGSALEYAKASKPADFKRFWVSFEHLLLPGMGRFFEDFSLQWDNNTNTFKNESNALIRPIDFGGVSGVDYLDVDIFGKGMKSTAYYAQFIDRLIQRAPYKKGINVRGAPFDFRMAIQHEQAQSWKDNFDALVEKMFYDNHNTTVVVVGHSLGGVYISWHLAEKDDAWKKTYIDTMVVVGAPLGGSSKALEAVVSGSDWGYEVLNHPLLPVKKVRDCVRTWPAALALLPNSRYGYSEPIVIVDQGKNYTANDMIELLNDAGATAAADILSQLKGVTNPIWTHPGVPVACYTGKGTNTINELYYRSGFTDKDDVVYTDGDGTVPISSARVCKDWASINNPTKQPFYYWEDNDDDHMSLVQETDVIDDIIDQVILRDEDTIPTKETYHQSK